MSNDISNTRYRGHLDHLEDLPVFYGVRGVVQAMAWLIRISHEDFGATLKIDGRFAIIAGYLSVRDSGYRKFVSTKSYLNKSPVRLFNDNDIEQHTPHEYVRKALKRTLASMSDDGPPSYYWSNESEIAWHGDSLFTASELETYPVVTVQANTIPYRITLPSRSLHQLTEHHSYDGIAWHTMYIDGQRMFNFNSYHPGEMNTRIAPTEKATFNLYPTLKSDVFDVDDFRIPLNFDDIPKVVGGAHHDILAIHKDPAGYKQLIERYINGQYEQHNIGFRQFIEESSLLNPKRRQEISESITNFDTMMSISRRLRNLRVLMLRKLTDVNSAIQPIDCPHEGIVLSSMNHRLAVKLVDREGFTQRNRLRTNSSWRTTES